MSLGNCGGTEATFTAFGVTLRESPQGGVLRNHDVHVTVENVDAIDTLAQWGCAVYMWPEHDKPSQDLPALPPSVVLETPVVLKATVNASRALATLDGACKRLPAPSMLINLVPIMEAQASSESENIVTTNDDLFRAAHGALAEETPEIREALRNREALRLGVNEVTKR